MNVFIATEYRIIECRGHLYVYEKLATILKRYYTHFGKLTICTRVYKSGNIDTKLIDVSEFIEKVISVTLWRTFLYLETRAMAKAIKDCDLVIGRFDSIVSCRAALLAKKYNKPFLAELMADAWDGYWNHGTLGKILAPYMFFATKKAVAKADYAIYVTDEFLQRRYPCKGESINASNVNITTMDAECLDKRIEKIKAMNVKHITLLTTAAVDVVAKGQRYVIEAIPELNKLGIIIDYRLIGGGDVSRLKQIAINYGVQEQVSFLGERSLSEVFAQIEEADVYIQPSLQEGLPRSVIEAMSKGCPCIGAKTAGIPELLPMECVFKRKSSHAIVEVIVSILSQNKLVELAKKDYNRAKDFQNCILEERRKRFLEKVKYEIQTPTISI